MEVDVVVAICWCFFPSLLRITVAICCFRSLVLYLSLSLGVGIFYFVYLCCCLGILFVGKLKAAFGSLQQLCNTVFFLLKTCHDCLLESTWELRKESSQNMLLGSWIPLLNSLIQIFSKFQQFLITKLITHQRQRKRGVLYKITFIIKGINAAL